MKNLKLIMGLTLMAILFTQCRKDLLEIIDFGKSDSHGKQHKGMFTVTIKNVSEPYDYFAAGAQFIPDGESGAGPAFPGHSFTVKFHAGKGHKLSFATMFGASNDLFFGPSESGIELFPGGTPLTGDITSMISLWDAGTEKNYAPGTNPNGEDENVPVKNIMNVNDGFDYGTVGTNIMANLEYDGTSMFTLTLHVLAGGKTPLSPVAWVVHSEMQKPIFTEGVMDYGNGLEALAETGNAAPLNEYLGMHSGYVSPIAPGVWVVHKRGFRPVFREGRTDYGDGLEMLSEMGDPSTLAMTFMDKHYDSGIYVIPDGGVSPAPIFPGESYTFSFDAKEGEYLSFASMLGKSNDLFFAPDEYGIKLFNGKNKVSGDITDKVMLWDAGTEPNEYPGAGIHQGPGGSDEHGVVKPVNDGFMYPDVNRMIKVTISNN